MNPFVAEIRCFGFNFAPTGWVQCNGQTLAISQYTALFSLLGTTYGGNGTSNFQLPNLQARIPMHAGQGPGLTDRFLGETGGSDAVTLLITEIPSHNHNVHGNVQNTGQEPTASNNFPAKATGFPAGDTIYNSANPNANFNPLVISVAGGSQPHNNVMPTLVLNFCIAMQGVFPPRG